MVNKSKYEEVFSCFVNMVLDDRGRSDVAALLRRVRYVTGIAGSDLDELVFTELGMDAISFALRCKKAA